jgi:hypothetical protein
LIQLIFEIYDSQINIISKPFELNKERLRKDFMSPKYENRRNEFFATYSEFLQTYIRKKYYDFMNDIQTEVNFFDWFDRNYKPKILNNRTKKKNRLQEENTKIAHKEISSHKSIVTSHRNQQLAADNIYLAKKETPLANQHGQINTINKNNTNINYKDKKNHKHKLYKLPTKDSKKHDIKQNTKKLICHKCKKIDHYQNNCISDKNGRNQPYKNNFKLKTPDLHSEINSLKQKIKRHQNI